MPTDPKVDLLSNVKMFSSLNKKELGLIARISELIQLDAGTTIVTQGEIGHEFYLILSGQASVRRNGRKIATLGPGRYFGELAILDRGLRSATVVADTDMQVVVIGQREFMGVLNDFPTVAYKLLVSMAARLRESDEKAVSN